MFSQNVKVLIHIWSQTVKSTYALISYVTVSQFGACGETRNWAVRTRFQMFDKTLFQCKIQKN